MLNELEIINFQCHLHSYFEFHPRVNLIRGTSHYGKSAVVRSLLWLSENDPGGISFLNWDKDLSDGVEVHASFKEGDVSRIRNDKFNGYVLPDLDDRLEALRGHVPEEVRVLTNMDKSNVQGQDDGYFLLRDSPGNIARKLNEKSGLEDIDKVNKITKRLLEDFVSRLKYTKKDLKHKLNRKEYLEEIAKNKETIEDIDSLYSQLDLHKHDLNDLQSRICIIEQIQRVMAKCELILEAKELTDSLVKLLDRRLMVSAKHTRLKLILSDATDLEDAIEMLEAELEGRPLVIEILQLGIDRDKLVQEWRGLYHIKENIEGINYSIKSEGDSILSLQMAIDEMLKDIEFCPTCGSEKEHWRYEILGDR